jgi:transposase
MKFVGIDVGADRHMVAIVGQDGEVLCRSSPFGEDASGYAHLFELLGPPEGCLLALEATGHYWRNLFVALLAKRYAVAVLNPLRTRRFAEEELQLAKTDAIDAAKDCSGPRYRNEIVALQLRMLGNSVNGAAPKTGASEKVPF